MAMRLMMVLGFGMFVVTGCVSQSKYDNDVSGLKTNVTTLASQVSRLDSALQDKQGTLALEQQKNAQLRAELEAASEPVIAVQQKPASSQIRGTYKTPSGFSLLGQDIQKALQNAGYYVGPIDGKIGPGSRSAIRDFQRDHSLTVDGVCGRRTWDKLKPYLSAIK